MKYISLYALLSVLILFASCKKEEKEVGLKNDLIKKTITPLLVGEKIQFAYAMGSKKGNLSNATAMASIAGATGTGFEGGSWRAEISGTENFTLVANGLITTGQTSSATFFVDTAASTLRYYYVIPEEARGKEISFEFNSVNKAGDKATYKTPAYKVSRMDMKRTITMVGTAVGACYFSIADMKAYTAAEVNAGNLSSKIDFVYAYAATVVVTIPTPGTAAYGHSLVSPSSANFPAGFTIPATWTKNTTLMERKIGIALFDGQLKGDVNIGLYIDDLDLQKQSFTGSAAYALGLTTDGGTFMKTADGKYTAYIYVNTVTNATSTAVISIKRYQNL